MLLLSPARWWVLGIQAGLNLAFSLALFLFQDSSGLMVVYSFGALTVVNGLLGCAIALRERHFLQHWWISAIIGGVNLGLGAFVLWYERFAAGISIGFLTVLVGILALFQGSMGFGVSLELNNKLKVKGAFLFYGILSMSGGILVLAAPYALALDYLNLIAIYAALAGFGQCLDSLRLKRMLH
jgi:uncharacterized membrane protein HdeD (DUF308 family)